MPAGIEKERAAKRGRYGSAGFWVVVLLILVASIPLLKPGFYRASYRSPVARVKGDHRFLSVAIESYKVDHGAYPPALVLLTTPIAYLGNLPFPDDPPYPYRTLYWPRDGNWFLVTAGLDRSFQIDEGTTVSMFTNRIYDPTNGTDSSGDIVRTNYGVFEPGHIPKFYPGQDAAAFGIVEP